MENQPKMQSIPKTFKKYCLRCEKSFRPTGKYQKICEKCKIIIRKETTKKIYGRNNEK